MTKLQGVEIIVCTFCFDAHHRWIKSKQPFSNAKKEAVKICFVCKHPMCADCVSNSQEELHGHVLGQIGLELCHTCIATVRRSMALKPILGTVAQEAIEYVRERVEIKLYTLMKMQNEQRDGNIT